MQGEELPSNLSTVRQATNTSDLSKSDISNSTRATPQIITKDNSADLSIEIQLLRKEIVSLKDENSRLRQEVTDTKLKLQDSERLQIALAKAEADLEGLSSAYSALELHSAELQARLDMVEKLSIRSDVANPNARENGGNSRKEIDDLNSTLEDLLVCLGQQEARVAELEKELAQARRN